MSTVRNVIDVWTRIERTAAGIEETCPKVGTQAYEQFEEWNRDWCQGAREVIQRITDGAQAERRGHGQGVSGE